MRAHRFAALIVALIGVACFNPDLSDITCGSGTPACPPGYVCGADDMCQRGLPGPDATPPESTLRVSVGPAGVQAADGSSSVPSISADGRYVAFASAATNLVTGDDNGFTDVFVHDTQTGGTTRVSVSPAGAEAIGGDSLFPSISADGRYVAFQSDATNLATGDDNGFTDVFVRDTQTETTIRVSVGAAGLQAVNGSWFPSISADGHYVAFESASTNLVTSDMNGVDDVFVHDTQMGTTIRVSVDSAGTEAGNNSRTASVSADGRYVAFQSDATNLVTNDTNGLGDVFVHDTQMGTTIRVSVDSAGAEADVDSFGPSISDDGRYIAFDSDAQNLVSDDSNGLRDVFVHDTQTGTTTRVSVDSAGAGALGSPSWFAAISADGRYVAFQSSAANLVTGDMNGLEDVFLHDTQTGTTTRVSVGVAASDAVGGASSRPSTSADGRYIAFESGATNLVAGDTNNLSDVFRAPKQ